VRIPIEFACNNSVVVANSLSLRKKKGGGNGGKNGRYDARHAEANRNDANKNEELFIDFHPPPSEMY
jgi:hypothetical protein